MNKDLIIKQVTSGTFEQAGEMISFASAIVDGEKFKDTTDAVGLVPTKLKIVDAEDQPNLDLAEKLKKALREKKSPISVNADLTIVESFKNSSVAITGVKFSK